MFEFCKPLPTLGRCFKILLLSVVFTVILMVFALISGITKATEQEIRNPNKMNNYKRIELLIIMIDDRIMSQHETCDYYHHSFCINKAYANKYSYTIILANLKDTKCVLQYHPIPVPIEWCKLEIIKYYLFNTEFISKYKWLLYLDSDSHIIKFDISFKQWLMSSPFIEDLRKHLILSNDNENWLILNQPKLIKQYNASQYIHQCCPHDSYANAGVLLFRFSNISQMIINEWSRSIDLVPTQLISNFPREQGALNCFISYKYWDYLYIFPWNKEMVNIFLEDMEQSYDNNVSYIVHMTSLPRNSRRNEKFKKFFNDINGEALTCSDYLNATHQILEIKISSDFSFTQHLFHN